MRKELQQRLFDACPLFYRYQSMDKREESLHDLMDLDLCCGDGWYPLLLDVSMKIEMICEQMKKQGYDKYDLPVAVWIKEKYGELCIHMDNETSDTVVLQDKAEALSATTCEACGQVGKMVNKSWITCLCEGCHKHYPLGGDVGD